MTKTKSTFLALLTVLLAPMAANADLIDTGGSTIDTSSGLEWLDLTATINQSYLGIVGGFGGYAAAGYVHATTTQLCGLYTSFGINLTGCNSSTNDVRESISQAAADLAVSFLGNTAGSGTGRSGSFGIFDGGLIGSGFVGLGCIDGGTLNVCANPNPDALRLLRWNSTSGTNSLVGNFLVRAANVPEPGTFALLGIGLLAMGAIRRRKV